MPALFLAKLDTPLTESELVRGILGGYRRVMNSTPPVGCLSSLSAQAFFESGRGKKVRNFNLGNTRPTRDSFFFTQYECDEIVSPAVAESAERLMPGHCEVLPWAKDPSKRRVVVTPPHPWTTFEAFETLEVGAAHFVAFHSCRAKWRSSWRHAFAGETEEFVLELGRLGYFTGPVDVYVKAVTSIEKALRGPCELLLGADEFLFSDEERDQISGIAFDALAEGIYERGEHRVSEDTDPAPPEEVT